MSSKTPEIRHRHILLSRSCIAIVLEREKADDKIEDFKKGANSDRRLEHGGLFENSRLLSVFADFVHQNSTCFWNPCLVKSITGLEFRGCLVPSTLMVAGTEFALEVVRSAWARRVLRPPKGYIINKLGDLSLLEMSPVPQTQFAPLSEALCATVAELNDLSLAATAPSVSERLSLLFPAMEVPAGELLHRTLGALIKERKLYHTGEGYFVVSPDTYRQRALSPLCERQMLMTNEEAIVRLHGDQRERSLAVQVDESDIAAAWHSTSSSSCSSSSKQNPSSSSQANHLVPPSPDWRVMERSHSFRILRVKGRSTTAAGEMLNRCSSFKETSSKKNENYSNGLSDSDNHEIQKCVKQSMLSKLLRRMQSLTDKPPKHVTFSAQFPPAEWFDPANIHCHSVATQTQVQLRKFHSKPGERHTLHVDAVPLKIPWEESELSEDKEIPDYLKSTSILRKLAADPDTYNNKKKSNVYARQGTSKYSPSHRYSHGTLTNYPKRHHKHRRSSSESPKIDKTKKTNEVRAMDNVKSKSFDEPSTESVKTSQNLLNGPQPNCSPKAIISPCSVLLTTPRPLTASSNTNSLPKTLPLTSSSNHSNFFRPRNSPLFAFNDNVNPHSADSSVSNYTSSAVLKSAGLIGPANSSCNQTPKKQAKIARNFDRGKVEECERRSNSESSSDLKLSLSESSSEPSMPYTSTPKRSKAVRPITLGKPNKSPKLINNATPIGTKSSPAKEIIIDNSVNVEVAVEKVPLKPIVHANGTKANNVSTTVSQTVTEETTVTKGAGNSKVVTVTSITTSLSHGTIKDLGKSSPEVINVHTDLDSEKEKNTVNDLNLESKKIPRIIDCSSSCNIVTEVK